jgi:2-dehydropantoate 2-reductase
MKIGVAGTGAVGGYFGGFLQKAGHDVVFLARGKHLKQMQEKGLTIESETGVHQVGGAFTENYQSLSDIDLLLFCVKSTSTIEVAEQLKPILKGNCLIMTLQNGVDNEEILSSIFGKERIISVATYIQATLKEPGVVKQIGVPPRLVIGSLDERIAGKITEINSLLNEAGIETFSTSHVLAIKWKKLLWNVTFNPLTALVEEKVSAIYDHEALNQTAIAICKEAIAVARELGIEIEEDFYESIMKQGQLAKNHQTSMLQDKLSGKAMEIESICGYIVKKGKEINVRTPVLETIYHLLSYQDLKNRTER